MTALRALEFAMREIDSAAVGELDGLAAKIWQAHLAGHISDEQAQVLAERVQRRRQLKAPAPWAALPDVALPQDVVVSVKLDDLVRRRWR